jgi:hypothetical protein
VLIETNLFRTGEALRRADRLDVTALPSRHRRASSLIAVSRAHMQRKEWAGAVHMIGKARRESEETARYDLFVRSALVEIAGRRTTVTADARQLAEELGIAV